MEVEKMLLILTINLKILNISKLDEKNKHYCNNTFSLDQTKFKELDCTNISILERPHKVITWYIGFKFKRPNPISPDRGVSPNLGISFDLEVSPFFMYNN